MPMSFSDLARKVVHCGMEPRTEQNRRIDPTRRGMVGRMAENIG